MIGLDIDFNSRFEMLKTFFNASRYTKDIRVFRTKHGYHLELNVDVDYTENIWVRKVLGDCAGRIALDEYKLLIGLYDWFDTLFEVKKSGTYSKNFVRYEINPLSDPFFSRCRG